MDDESLKPDGSDELNLHIQTTDRVGEMTDQARVDLAREIARRKLTYADTPASRANEVTDPNASAEALRLTAELHKIDVRLDRLERNSSSNRFQSGGGWAGTRYVRLMSRARRLERQLRSLT